MTLEKSLLPNRYTTREWGIERDLIILFANLVKLSCKALRQVVGTR